jgi:hypothetical protein
MEDNDLHLHVSVPNTCEEIVYFMYCYKEPHHNWPILYYLNSVRYALNCRGTIQLALRVIMITWLNKTKISAICIVFVRNVSHVSQ